MPVVGPVGVLSGNVAVVIDQEFHRVRERYHFGSAVDLYPGAEEAVVEHAQGGARVAAQVARFIGGLAATDDGPADVIDANGHGRQLRPAATAPRGQHRTMAGGEELLGCGTIHDRLSSMAYSRAKNCRMASFTTSGCSTFAPCPAFWTTTAVAFKYGIECLFEMK